jgi:hypothetical protein
VTSAPGGARWVVVPVLPRPCEARRGFENHRLQQVVDPDDAQAMDGLPWSTVIFDAKKAETLGIAETGWSQKLDG